ncbi:uncharacterized protein LOC125657690 isoform X2 [Ostrea edulis]|nr:uncharacterized protein LOC125657690 isoform X2 [Ostrea edulis]
MCNNPSFTAKYNWTITEISSRQLLKFKSVKYWKVSGKAGQPNEVTVCPLFKEIKIQFGYNVIDCGSCLFHCKAFSAKNDDTTEKFIRNIASRGIQRIVVKADTLKEANEALTFCQKYRHFIYVNAGFNAYLEEQGVRACLRQLKQSCTGLACIGDIPLCYRKGKLAKDRQLSNFKELVPFCYNRQIPIHFHVGPNECIHENFLQALSSYPLMIYSWCISFDEDSLFTEKDVATLINKFRCFVMVDAHNLKCNSRFVSLMEKKIIPVEKILLRSNAPFSFFGKSKKETWHSMKDFQVHFLRKQLRYLHPESLETMFSEDGSSVPTILCCMIELLAGIVDVPPLSLAKILIKNAESFFKFSDPSISYSSQSRDANP